MVTDIGTQLEQDLQVRRTAVRRTEILLKVEQWGSGHQGTAGDWVRDMGDFVDATDEERAWLRQHLDAIGMPPETGRSTEQWSEVRRERARQANAAASAAFGAGEYGTARDLIDDARAHGGLTETEWVRLHQFIVAKATENAVVDGTVPTQRAA